MIITIMMILENNIHNTIVHCLSGKYLENAIQQVTQNNDFINVS